MAKDLQIDDRVCIPAHELTWTAVRASGPGGQNVNKLATKIDLRFDLVATTALADDVKDRLRALPGVRLDAEGFVVVTSQQARTQAGNLAAARARLAELITLALVVPRRRRATRPSAGAKRRRLEGKRATSRRKADRARVVSD